MCACVGVLVFVYLCVCVGVHTRRVWRVIVEREGRKGTGGFSLERLKNPETRNLPRVLVLGRPLQETLRQGSPHTSYPELEA